MRTTKKAMVENVLDIKEAKIIKNNTLRIVYKNGNRAVRFHRTDIVTVKPNGDIVLRSGGWRTATTKARINEFSRLWVRQVRGKWYVYPINDRIVAFYDGITFDLDGNHLRERKI